MCYKYLLRKSHFFKAQNEYLEIKRVFKGLGIDYALIYGG